MSEPKEQTPLNEYDLISKSFSVLENKVSALQTDVHQSLQFVRWAEWLHDTTPLASGIPTVN